MTRGSPASAGRTTVLLRPMTAEQFPEFRELIVASYAADNLATGRWHASDASLLSEEDTDKALHAGVDTPGCLLFAMTVRSVAEPVGYLWATAFGRGLARSVFVCQVIVKPPYRRRGYARSALQGLEQLARQTGHDSIGLTVFATNEGARALYDSLGYRPTSITMQKDFSPAAGRTSAT